MRAFKIIFKFLPFIAVVFAAAYFLGVDSKLDINRPNFVILGLSYIILILTFISKAVLWYLLLLRFGVKISFRVAFASQFRSILMKYIPGKIWIILGRANIVSQQGISLKYCSFISSFMQVVTILSGMLVGVFGMVLFSFFYVPSEVCYAVLFIIILIIIIFSRERTIPGKNEKVKLKFLQPLMGRKIPPVSDIIMLSGFHWILMGFAFYLFIKAIYIDVGLFPIMLQPLAINIGIITPFAPSGLGVREGVMIGYLLLAGMSVASAANISIAARIWFFGGEVLVFISGWALQKKREAVSFKE